MSAAATPIISNSPEMFLKSGFPYHVKCGLFHIIFWWEEFPWTEFLQLLAWYTLVEIGRLWKIFSPGDLVKKLVFCAVPWSVIINLSSNFTKITLRCGCFPVCLPHESPIFQGHLCWNAEWRHRRYNAFYVMT